ncbi:MAG TPA: glycine oxidase ThiO [Gemmatimonadota bacterium]|nr:glycine oxidase ThiO [Gemmatimonadota bacterium]
MRSPDALVIGGGLIGCSIARALAADGRTVVVLERNREPGAEASRAAAGLLVPQTERAMGRLGAGSAAAEDAMLALLLESQRRFPAFARDLEEVSGRSVHYRGEGSLVAALSAEEAAALAAFARRQADRGLPAEWIEGSAARRLEPALGPAVRAALLVPGDHQVDNVELTLAAVEAAKCAGVEIRTSAAVAGIVARDGRAAGVRLEDGTRLDAALVLLAAGAWSGGLEGLPRELPVRPVKGQMIAVVPPPPASIRRIVSVPGAYCVPRDDGRVLVGATVEEAGFDTAVDEVAARRLVAAAARALPGFAAAPVVAHWAGLRPGTPDGLPILGEDPDLPGLVYATGHYRNGILLAPVTAAIVGAIGRGDEPPVAIEPFSPARPALGPREPPFGS